MKVLLCDPFAYSADYNVELFAALKSAGLDVEYLTSENVHLPREAEIAVPGRSYFFLRWSKERLRRRRWPAALVKALGGLEYIFDLSRLYRKAVREDAVVHILWIKHPAVDFLYGLRFARLKKFVYTMHNALPHDAEGFVNRLCYALYYRLPDQIIALGRSEIDKALALDRGLSRRVNHIPHGLLFLNVPERDRDGARRELAWEDGHKVVLFWGNIVPYKGIDDLLEAFTRLRGGEYRLAVAGKWSMSPTAERRWRARALADGRVSLHEGVLEAPRVRDLLCASDLLVLPYKEASQSGVGFTALRYGCPILVTRAGSLAEMLPNEYRESMVVPANSPERLSAAISAFFARTREERAAAGNSFKAYGGERYSWEIIARRTLAVYRRLDR